MSFVWKPNPGPQTEAFKRSEYELLYGGAAGGGKSEFLIHEAARYVKHPAYRAYIFRRESPQLADLMDKAARYYPAIYGGQLKEAKSEYHFPSGAIIRFRHMEHSKDWQKYQGHEMQFSGFDELTQFEQSQYDKIKIWVRSSIREIPARIRATSNPRGIGHAWVKQRFVDAGAFNRQVDRVKGANGKVLELDRIFIPAKATDNPQLVDNDPTYIARLMLLPEQERKAYLDGSWDFYEGQFFTEWRPEIHCVHSFETPNHWRRFATIDYGFAAPWVAYMIYVGPDKKLYVRHEISRTRLTDQEQAELFAKTYWGHPPEYVTAGPDLWNKSGKGAKAVSTAETYQKVWADLAFPTRLIMADNNRVMGWRRVRDYLRPYVGPDGKQTALLQVVASECPRLLETIPTLPHDENNPDDIHDRADDHYAEALRLGLMSRPVPRPDLPDPVSSSFSEMFKKLVAGRRKISGIGAELQR